MFFEPGHINGGSNTTMYSTNFYRLPCVRLQFVGQYIVLRRNYGSITTFIIWRLLPESNYRETCCNDYDFSVTFSLCNTNRIFTLLFYGRWINLKTYLIDRLRPIVNSYVTFCLNMCKCLCFMMYNIHFNLVSCTVHILLTTSTLCKNERCLTGMSRRKYGVLRGWPRSFPKATLSVRVYCSDIIIYLNLLPRV